MVAEAKEALLEKKQPFWEHLIELRFRLIRAFIAWVLGSILAYVYSDDLISLLINPLQKILPPSQHLVYFKTLPEVFSVQIKLSLICGFFIGSPYIFYQIWLFVAPGLYPHEKKLAKLVFFLSSFAFIIGILVAYFFFLPALIYYLYSFGERFLQFKPYLSEYINFVLKLFIFIGASFQLPTALVVLTKLSIVSKETLKKTRPYAILASFIASAFLTPSTDPVNQILLALTLTFLFELGIFLSWIIK
ncbi:MAG: twin-arginine translocase subunit TatC [Caldimicrobium sp.]|jgi:sec-independent protein translocase protein TatC|nr:twin-arginine translocase subunit TatC [Caldimicrobium sp.]